MKQIYVNLKRFDIPPALGGVNRIAEPACWGATLASAVAGGLDAHPNAAFTFYFPEAHLLPARAALPAGSVLRLGCQGVWGEDTQPGGNFGAYTTGRTAHSMAALGCSSAIIGHCEERRYLQSILAEAGVQDDAAISRLLNRSALKAQAAGLHVLLCVGETLDQRVHWQRTLSEQVLQVLDSLDLKHLTLAYEPVWAIGPGKMPPDQDQIREAARHIKGLAPDVPLVYGGGLKLDNAKMLAGIFEIDGGLIALTRFQGEIGFYPQEFLAIVEAYMEEVHQ